MHFNHSLRYAAGDRAECFSTRNADREKMEYEGEEDITSGEDDDGPAFSQMRYVTSTTCPRCSKSCLLETEPRPLVTEPRPLDAKQGLLDVNILPLDAKQCPLCIKPLPLNNKPHLSTAFSTVQRQTSGELNNNDNTSVSNGVLEESAYVRDCGIAQHSEEIVVSKRSNITENETTSKAKGALINEVIIKEELVTKIDGVDTRHNVDTGSSIKATSKAESDTGISKMCEHWLAGLLHHASALNTLCAPTVNCYRRLNRGFAPGKLYWEVSLSYVLVPTSTYYITSPHPTPCHPHPTPCNPTPSLPTISSPSYTLSPHPTSTYYITPILHLVIPTPSLPTISPHHTYYHPPYTLSPHPISTYYITPTQHIVIPTPSLSTISPPPLPTI